MKSKDNRDPMSQIPLLSQPGSEKQEPPRKRQRISLACDRCRNRKIKCNGVKPTCGTCERLLQHQPGEELTRCIYQADRLKSGNGKKYVEALKSHIRKLEQKIPRSLSNEDGIGHTSPMRIDISSQPHCDSLEEVEHVTSIINRHEILQHSQVSHGSIITYQPAEEALYGAPNTDSFSGTVLPARIQALATSVVQKNPSPRRSESLLGFPSPANHETAYHQASIQPSNSGGSMLERGGNVSALGAAMSSGTTVVPLPGNGFYGASSAISFYLQIQDASKQPIQSDTLQCRDQASVSTQSSFVSSSEFDKAGEINLDELHLTSRSLADILLESYWEHVHCLYPVVHKSSFLVVYCQLWKMEDVTWQGGSPLHIGLGSKMCTSSVFYCGLYAMLALGCNFSDMPYERRVSLAKSFCERSLNLALKNLLDDNSLALVQALFILAQLLQSTDHPTRCWNVVGLALRVAQGIGLYIDNPSLDHSLLETEIKRRTWHACLLLDVVTSMTLGRPALAPRKPAVPLPAALEDAYLEGMHATGAEPTDRFSKSTFFVQTLKLYTIFGEVLTNVYEPWQDRSAEALLVENHIDTSIKTVIDLERDLAGFKSALPQQLDWDGEHIKGNEPPFVERQRNILYARYLHLQVLLYRPIFHHFCVQSHRNLQRKSCTLEQGLPDQSVKSFIVKRYAAVCLDSAQKLIAFINQSSQARTAGAWWYNIFYLFSCAMIIILAESTCTREDIVARDGIEESWRKCLGTLEQLSSKHARARICAETLIKLREQSLASQGESSNNWQEKLHSERGTGSESLKTHSATSGQTRESPVRHPFYSEAAGVSHDPLLEDVLLRQADDSQMPWDLLDPQWWQSMLDQG